jgi:hypothetical protein
MEHNRGTGLPNSQAALSDREMPGMTHKDRGGWRKSSRSATGGGGNCVEVVFVDRMVGVRDSKNVSGPALSFSGTAWRAFVSHP